jgi:hypothetical protein
MNSMAPGATCRTDCTVPGYVTSQSARCLVFLRKRLNAIQIVIRFLSNCFTFLTCLLFSHLQLW